MDQITKMISGVFNSGDPALYYIALAAVVVVVVFIMRSILQTIMIIAIIAIIFIGIGIYTGKDVTAPFRGIANDASQAVEETVGSSPSEIKNTGKNIFSDLRAYIIEGYNELTGKSEKNTEDKKK